jgi:hypothetical protein
VPFTGHISILLTKTIRIGASVKSCITIKNFSVSVSVINRCGSLYAFRAGRINNLKALILARQLQFTLGMVHKVLSNTPVNNGLRIVLKRLLVTFS